MTTTGTSSTSLARRIDAALQPYLGERSAFAHQLDLYYRLAVRMVLAGAEATELIQQSYQRRQHLETVLLLPHALWLNGGEKAFRIRQLTAAAIDRFAPDLAGASAPGARPAIPFLFDDLGKLLSDTDEFYARLNTLNWGDRYRPVGKTFQAQAALIIANGDEWKFNYDRTGRGLGTTVESQKVPYGGADWIRNGTFIHEVVSALQEFLALTPTFVDLTFLSTELRILPTSPPWSATAPALERLDQFRANRRHYEQFADDVLGVGEFAKMLAANQLTLSDALFCAGVIGRFAASDFGTGLVAGLRTISRPHRFADTTHSGDPTRSAFAPLADELCGRRPELTDPLRELREACRVQDQTQWSARLRELAAGIRTRVSFTPEERGQLLEEAWTESRQFLLKESPAATFSPGIAGLFCRAGGIGPSMVLRDRPADMLLVEWSAIYCRALAGKPADDVEFVPRWLAVVAALALGSINPTLLPLVTLSSFREALSADETRSLGQTASEWSRGRASRPFGLVVYAPSPSAVTLWVVPQEYGAAAWTPAQAIDAFERVKSTAYAISGLPAIDYLFIDVAVAEPETKKVIELVTRAVGNRKVSITGFSLSRGVSKPAWADRLVQQPADATALMRTAEARVVHRVDDLPAAVQEIWLKGARLTGTIENPASVGKGDKVEVFVGPGRDGVRLSWNFRGRDGSATLSFTGTGLLRTGRFVERGYALLYDGVTLRIEQRAAWLRGLPGRFGRLVARLLVPAESIELREEPEAWTGDLVVGRRSQGVVTERRSRIRLGVVGQLTNAPRPTADVQAPRGESLST